MRSEVGERLRALRGKRWADIWAIVPVLILIGLPIVTILVVGTLLLAANLLRPSLAINGTRMWDSDLDVFAVAISLITIGVAVSGSPVSWIAALLVIGLLVAVRNFRSAVSPATRNATNSIDLPVLQFVAIYSGTLTLLGWSSLRYFAFSLILVAVIRRYVSSNAITLYAIPTVSVGFVLSYFELRTSEGQFWLSYDQLFRSSLATGLANWGINDQIGAIGTTVRYHWLGEGVSGVLADAGSTSAINGVTRIVPALGILICLTALVGLGEKLGFNRVSSAIPAVLTIVLGQVFEVFSVGSLWGIALFLIGVHSLIRLKSSIEIDSISYRASCVSIVIVTPLITLAQSTLGVHFVLSTAVIYLSTAKRIRTLLLSAGTVLTIQLLSVLVLRRTLLSSDDQHFYQPSVSVRNLMQFRGVDIYVGSQNIYVFGASLLYLLVMSQLFAGLWLSSRNSEQDRHAINLFMTVSVVSLILANIFSLGGPWAQQARFFVPMLTVGTYLSLAMITRGLFVHIGMTQYVLRTWLSSALIGVAVLIAILCVKYTVFGLAWSRTRTAAIALTIVTVQILLILVVVGHQRSRIRGRTSPVFVCLFLSVAVAADGQQVRDLIGIHRMDLPSRAESILGNSDTQDCLEFVRRNTTQESVVASNWYRIPASVRSAKYALVGASLERRTYLDGPNYIDLPRIDTPRPTPLEQRAIIVDGFAERASPESYEVLRSYGVEYFLVDRLEVTPATWQPYADVVLKNERCFVLKLSS